MNKKCPRCNKYNMRKKAVFENGNMLYEFYECIDCGCEITFEINDVLGVDDDE